MLGVSWLGLIVLVKNKESAAQDTQCLDFNQAELNFNGQSVSVAVARNSAERKQGLAGCSVVPENVGLYFPYETAQPATFWMKGMLIPIDIIWIANGKVIGIEHNVPPPKNLVDTSNLPQYHSPEPVDAVLEMAAGNAKALGISKNTDIVFVP